MEWARNARSVDHVINVPVELKWLDGIVLDKFDMLITEGLSAELAGRDEIVEQNHRAGLRKLGLIEA